MQIFVQSAFDQKLQVHRQTVLTEDHVEFQDDLLTQLRVTLVHNDFLLYVHPILDIGLDM